MVQVAYSCENEALALATLLLHSLLFIMFITLPVPYLCR